MKIKIISILITSVLIGIGAFSASGEFLDGDINVEITDSLGIVYPHIDLTNISEIVFNPEFVEDGSDSYWEINETLDIALDVNDNSGRENFFFPRSVVYSAMVIRKNVKILPLAGLFRRMIPVIVIGKSVNIVDSQLGKNKSITLTIPIKYTVYNESPEPETMVLHLLVMGMLPGDLDGIDGIKWMEYKSIELSVNYSLP